MKNIYLPINNVNDYQCYYVYNENTIRAYKSKPQINSTSEYVDFYINSHYLQKNGIQSWGNYNNNLPVCLSTDVITNDYYYRNDFDSILFMFSIFVLFGFYVPIKIFSKIFRKGVL